MHAVPSCPSSAFAATGRSRQRRFLDPRSVVFCGVLLCASQVGWAWAQPLAWSVELRHDLPGAPPDLLRVWNLATGVEEARFESPPAVTFGWTGVTTPDGRYYLLPTTAGIARFRTGPITFDRIIGPATPVYYLSVAPTGTRVHAIGSNGRAVVDWESGAVISPDCCNISAVQFTPDGSIRVEHGWRGPSGQVDSVAAFRESTGSLLWENEIDPGVQCGLGAVSASYVAMYCGDWYSVSEVIIWRVLDGVEVRRLQDIHTSGLAWVGDRLLISGEKHTWGGGTMHLSAYDPQTQSMRVITERAIHPLASFSGSVVVSPGTGHAYWQTMHRPPLFDTDVTLYDVIDLASGTLIGTGRVAGFHYGFTISESPCRLDVPAMVAAPIEGGVVGIPVIPAASCFAWSVPGQPAVLNPGPHAGAATLMVQTWANVEATPKTTAVALGRETVLITQPAGPPAAPTLDARVVGDRVELSWTPAIGAGITSFVVRGGLLGDAVTDVLELPGHLRTWRSPALRPGSYQVEIMANNGAGRSPASNSRSFSVGVREVPHAPVNLTATVHDDRVALTWTPASSGPAPEWYLIEAAGTWDYGSVIVRSDTSSFVATRVQGGALNVSVRGATAGGVSEPSEVINVILGPCSTPPGAPQLPWALWTPPAVTLRWSPPLAGSVDDYVIEVGTAIGLADLGRLVVTGDRLSHTQDVAAPTAAFVRVRARNACGESAPSTEVPIVLY
jgi:hypothetical protein